MAGRLKHESVKLLACFTSLSLQLQNLLLVYIKHSKILDNLLQKNSLKKKNYFSKRVIKRFIEQLKPEGRDIFWQNLINCTSRDDKCKKNFRLTK